MNASGGHRFAQRFLCNNNGGFKRAARTAIATTSRQIARIDQRNLHTSLQNGASASCIGSFRPSLPTMAKKRSSSKIKGALDEMGDEIDDEDDGTAFDVDSDYTETSAPAAEESIKSRPRESFQVVKSRCHEKLEKIQEGLDAEISLGKSDWNDLLVSATSSDDMQDVLNFRKQWFKLTTSQYPAIKSLSARQGRSFLTRSQQLKCIDLSFEVLSSKSMYGFDCDLPFHRSVQESLLSKAIFMRSNRAKSKLAKMYNGSSGESLKQDHEQTSVPSDGVESVNEQTNSTLHLATKAKLEIIDKMMALSALTRKFSVDVATPDHYCILLTIRGIIDPFYLLDSRSGRTEEETVKEKELLPRLSRALNCLSDIVIDSQMPVSGVAAISCSRVVRYLIKDQRSLIGYNSDLKLNIIRIKLEEILKHCHEKHSALAQEHVSKAKASLNNDNI